MSSSPSNISTSFNNFGVSTVELRQSPGAGLADDCQNIVKKGFSSGIEKRNGYSTKLSGYGGYGLFSHKYTNVSDSTISEILLADTNLYRLKTGTLNITYVGASAQAVASIAVSNGSLFCTLYVNNVSVSSTDLGTGIDTASPTTVSSLSSTIDALADFTSSVTGTGTVAAAFLDLTTALYLPVNETKTINFNYYEAVSTARSPGFLGIQQTRGTSSDRNVCVCSHNQMKFMADGVDLSVYDGQSFYTAGLPVPLPPVLEKKAGKLNGQYFYSIGYSYSNALGKITSTGISVPEPINLVDEDVDLTIRTIDSSTGYNTNCGIVSGTQTITQVAGSATITLNSLYHTLRAGDLAYFKNRQAEVNDYVYLNITAVTSSTITVSTTADITVNDGDVISNGMAINIVRQDSIGGVQYLIDSIPNNSFGKSVKYSDTTRYCTVNGDQVISGSGTTATFTVTNNTLVVGDIITMTNRLNGSVFVAEVTASTSTSLSILYGLDINVTNLDTIVAVNYNYTVYTDVLQDPAAIPAADFCVSYKGNLVLAKGTQIFWSDERDVLKNSGGQSFPGSGFSEQVSSTIVGLAVSGDSLIIFQKGRIDGLISRSLSSAVSGTNPYNLYTISDSLGCIGQQSIISFGAHVYFCTVSGIYRIYNGVLEITESGAPVEISKPIKHLFTGLDELAYSRISGGIDSFKSYLMWTLTKELPGTPGYSTEETKTIVLDLQEWAWTIWSNYDITGGSCNQDGQFYFSSRQNAGTLRRLINKPNYRPEGPNFNDHHKAIEAWYETKWDALDYQGSLCGLKTLRRLKLYSVQSDSANYLHTPAITVKVYKDYINKFQQTLLTYNFDKQGLDWGHRWNDQPILSYRPASESQTFNQDVCEAVKLLFYNNQASTNMNITGWAIEYSPIDSGLKV